VITKINDIWIIAFHSEYLDETSMRRIIDTMKKVFESLNINSFVLVLGDK
jgi:hypothetical protein